MPVLSCGGMRFQHSWKDAEESGITPEGQANLEATVRRAVELGINHIETARDYGTSEVQLGRFLPDMPRGELIIQTKLPPRKTADKFLRDFDISMRNLRLDRVDLLSIHGINLDEHIEQSVRPGGCLEAARRLQAEGRVGAVGFSTHGPTDVVLRAIETDGFDYVNLHWYYINQLNWPAVRAAAARDMGVFIISPSDKGGMLYKPPAKLVELCRPLSPMAFNDLFCLSRPEVHTLSVGAARPADFDEHVAALEHAGRAAEIVAPIVEKLEAEMARVMGREWVEGWSVGLPPPEITPAKINIQVALWLRNLALAWDMTDYAKMRYNLLGSGGHWFPGEQAGGVEELDLSECLAASPHAGDIPRLLRETHEMLGGERVQRLSAS